MVKIAPFVHLTSLIMKPLRWQKGFTKSKEKETPAACKKESIVEASTNNNPINKKIRITTLSAKIILPT
ncbi:MAG: hypothetical protein AAF380_02065 [Bacteroidota bacterium]